MVQGFAYVELESEEEVAVAEQRLNHKYVQGRRITVKKSDPSRGRGQQQQPHHEGEGGQGGSPHESASHQGNQIMPRLPLRSNGLQKQWAVLCWFVLCFVIAVCCLLYFVTAVCPNCFMIAKRKSPFPTGLWLLARSS